MPQGPTTLYGRQRAKIDWSKLSCKIVRWQPLQWVPSHHLTWGLASVCFGIGASGPFANLTVRQTFERLRKVKIEAVFCAHSLFLLGWLHRDRVGYAFYTLQSTSWSSWFTSVMYVHCSLCTYQAFTRVLTINCSYCSQKSVHITHSNAFLPCNYSGTQICVSWLPYNTSILI